jgi:hypothetical protein
MIKPFRCGADILMARAVAAGQAQLTWGMVPQPPIVGRVAVVERRDTIVPEPWKRLAESLVLPGIVGEDASLKRPTKVERPERGPSRRNRRSPGFAPGALQFEAAVSHRGSLPSRGQRPRELAPGKPHRVAVSAFS